MKDSTTGKTTVPPCREDCPAGIDVPRYIRCIQNGDFSGSLAVIREKIPFPAVCGYACVRPCEIRCARIQVDEAMAIRMLKQAASEYGTYVTPAPEATSPSGHRVAVIGSGPAGLAAAYYLVRIGHKVEVFDKDQRAGGMMRYAIPEYRLPEQALDDDLRFIWQSGVVFNGGRSIRLADILGKYDAILIATGNQLSKRLAIEGSELSGVLWGLDFLRSVKANEKVSLNERVCVIGGGNVAVDAALSAGRLEAKEVRIICLEERDAMPAYPWEIAQALEEGITIEDGWGPKVIHGKNGSVTGIECVRCTSVFDDNHMFNPSYDLSVTRYFDADTVIFAIGQTPDIDFIDARGLKTHGDLIKVDTDLMTGIRGVFAAGEAATGPSSIIDAIAQGRQAAASIDRYLGGTGSIDRPEEEYPCLEVHEPAPRGTCRHKGAVTDPAERLAGFDPVEPGYDRETAVREALRCLACDVRQFTVLVDPLLCKECGYCKEVCTLNVFASSDAFNPSGYKPVIVKDSDRCVGCLKCLYICPDFAVSIRNGGKKPDDEFRPQSAN
ncbi:MAG: NAD-dependent dihydropyrimidine dehydrogenase subunit PreT [Syntrophorhabdus sp. PtaU1.Bin002]|nr:MAG: NAD-dependent dihydropyrimidine dehydrogenase subunit PreT [Syntrophorhabdus sp. PtaB.Bin006]OPY73665.1 MAG: NAD-dependent dihydropyrimidine dehydrogenase subunit PreT [Syntrophorhabdus sp. PtaU1.Bin002]